MYDLLPLNVTPERAHIVSKMMRAIAATPTIFSTSDDISCIEEARGLPEMCETCLERMRTVSEVLGASDTRAFEVWDETEVVGVIFFTRTTAIDAVGHYVFFDRSLRDKTEVIQEAMAEMMTGVTRLTIEIPESFTALIRHASRKLGFGGDIPFDLKGKTIGVEGVKRAAAMRGGRAEDLVVLGFVP